MPDGRGATLLDDLPEEIIDNILARLPSKDVGRCRAVSTSWRSATSTPEFTLRHHRRQPSLPIIDGRVTFVAFRAGASSQQKLWPFLLGLKHRKNCLRGACDGMLAVSWKSRFYVCNPVLRKHALLPQPQHAIGLGQVTKSNIVGFYRHHPTGQHRVLWVSQHLGHDEYGDEYALHILTLGCDTLRHVGVRLPATKSSPSMEHKLLYKLFSSPRSPLADNGNLHWHPYFTSSITGVTVAHEQILVFDAEAESFRWMSYPAQLTYNVKFFSMKGRLALSGTSGSTSIADVWVMRDYEAEIWAFEYRIDLSMVEASRQPHLTCFEMKKETQLDNAGKWIYDMVMLDDERELLIMCNQRYVVRCDVDGRFLGMVDIGESQSQYGIELTKFRLKESIIPIPYRAMQGEDEEEPFSIENV